MAKIDPFRECAVCGSTYNIHKHHVFGGANRKNSEKFGLVEDLCYYHHNGSDEGVHFDKDLDLYFKQKHQKEFEREYSREYFMEIFGKNYL